MTPGQRSAERIIAGLRNDPQMARLVPLRTVNERISQPGLSDQNVVAAIFAGYEDRPALGERRYEIARDTAAGRSRKRYFADFTTITYGEVRRRVEALANAWRHHAEHGLEEGAFVGILGFTSLDLAVAELACIYARAVAVPLQANLDAAELARIVEDVAPPVMIAAVQYLEIAVSLASANTAIRSIIVLDFDPGDDDDLDLFHTAESRLSSLGSRVSLAALGELVEFGNGFEWTPSPAHPLGEERPAALIYTSGATGTPKGAIFPERVTRQYWTDSHGYVPRITVSYAPLDHMMGRHALFVTLASGGTVYFTLSNDLSALLEDIRLVRPTYLVFIPRFAQLIYQHYRMEVRRRSSAAGSDMRAIAAQVRAEMRSSFLGNRLVRGMIGGAPTSPEIVNFLRHCFDFPLVEAYGSTESGGMTANNRLTASAAATYKLRDAPALGYLRTDTPFARGELLIRTRTQISGYFKDPEATARLFDSEGYVATGDIVEERGPGHLVWLDRTDDVLKLSQGEYVAIGALQSLFESHSTLVKQIYLYGNSVRSYLLAVVVPDQDAARALAGRMPAERELHDLIRAALVRVARDKHLKRFELPRLAIVEPESFSMENGLLSSLGKYRMRNLRLKYGERLERYYAEGQSSQADRLAELQSGGAKGSILEKVGQALAAFLGLDALDPSESKSFSDLGGDSLSAVGFASLLEQMFGVDLPVSAILSPAGNVATWARAIEALLDGTGRRVARNLADVHRKSSHVLHARDLRFEAFVDLPMLYAGPVASIEGPARTVLLTGATGHLGRFLCLGWLERLVPMGGKLVCLVRASDSNDARRRLEKCFDEGDPRLARRFHLLARNNLEVVAGDISEFHLGLADADYDRLGVEVDQIVHAAAMVNHALPYDHLFVPNVVGTAELIAFALIERRKRFDFLSSTVVTRLAEGKAPRGEDMPLPERLALKTTYAAGYTASKWAGETLLRDAHARFGLPVRIFRTSMILAHQTAAGQINVPDMFTRLLYSIVTTGLAPKSFYRPVSGGKASGAHYDGLPVDVVAAAIGGIGADAYSDLQTYHVSNFHHGDGVSLDRIVDWIVSAGYPIERIASHTQWIGRFERSLRALSDEQRLLSALEILGAFRRPYPAEESEIGSQRFQAWVEENPRLEIPSIGEAFIHKCLADLRGLGFIS